MLALPWKRAAPATGTVVSARIWSRSAAEASWRLAVPVSAAEWIEVFEASGKATLHSYVIHHRPVPGFKPPYAIAVVELAEGPRMMTNIVDCPQTPEALVLDMPLEVAFTKMDEEITLALFRPAKGG